jgi:Transposase domain (DUF772)
MKLQLVLFFAGIRSERQLLRLATDRLSVRWYLGYNLDEPLPDHSSLTRIRLRYGVEVFRRFFEASVEQCQEAGLVWGRELSFDATQVQANAAMHSLTARFAVEAREALHAHLAALFADETDSEPSPPDPPDPQNLAHREGTDSAATAAVPHDLSTPLPTALSEGERAALVAALVAANETRHDWIMAEGKPQREVRGPNNYYQRVADFRVSTTDPDATPLRLKSGVRTWATRPTMWLMAAKDASSSACWSPRRGHGEPTDAGPGLACPLSVPSAGPPSHRGHHLWRPGEHLSS